MKFLFTRIPINFKLIFMQFKNVLGVCKNNFYFKEKKNFNTNHEDRNKPRIWV